MNTAETMKMLQESVGKDIKQQNRMLNCFEGVNVAVRDGKKKDLLSLYVSENRPFVKKHRRNVKKPRRRGVECRRVSMECHLFKARKQLIGARKRLFGMGKRLLRRWKHLFGLGRI